MRFGKPGLLRSLRVFCVAAQHLSFKAAADFLSLTPSAVSHQIRALEDELGVPLFERKTRALELTSVGRALSGELGPLLESIDQAMGRASMRRARRSLRAALPPFFASELFVPRLASLYALQPDLDIQVVTGDARPNEHAASADVSVLLVESAPADLQAYELLSMKLVAACSRGLSHVAHGRLPELLKETSLIVHRARRDAWSAWAEKCGLGEPAPKGLIEVDSWMAVVRAAERGLGLALVPSALCTGWFARGALVQISADEIATGDTYYLVHRHEDGRRREVRALVSWALTELRR